MPPFGSRPRSGNDRQGGGRRGATGQQPSDRRRRRLGTGVAAGRRHPARHPLNLPEPSWVIALRGNIIITAGGRDVGIHQPGLHDPYENCFLFSAPGRPTRPPDNGRLSGTSADMRPVITRAGADRRARLGHVIRYIGRAGAMAGDGQRRCARLDASTIKAGTRRAPRR